MSSKKYIAKIISKEGKILSKGEIGTLTDYTLTINKGNITLIYTFSHDYKEITDPYKCILHKSE